MKKIALIITMLLVSYVAFAGNGLLWKVSGNGLAAPSYVLGSHHLAPAEFVDSIAGLKAAIKDVSAVYGEVDKAALTAPESQQKMMLYVVAPVDSTLSKLLSPADLKELDTVLAGYTGRPGMVAQMEMMKPAMVSAQLALLQLTAAYPKANLQQAFDAAIMALGEAQGKEVGGLETVEKQMTLLFCSPLKTQAEDLVVAVKNNDKLVRQAYDLTQSYLKQDLDAVTRITTDPEFGVTSDDLERLIYSRNRAWVDELQQLMPRKSMLLVVGCGHLGGDQGVLNLLREKGFNVEPVN